MILVLGFCFLMSSQPIVMIINLILITLLYSLYMYKILGGFWYSYVLLLIMLSGVMVVFTYMASLMPNESFEIHSMIFIFIFVMFFMYKGLGEFGEELSLISLNMWFLCVGGFNLFLVVFLLCLMVMVVQVSCIEEGAVRSE